MRADELNIDATNRALSQVKGLKLENIVPVTGGDNGSFDPKELKIEETNQMVMGIAGGFLSEDLDPKKPIVEGKQSKPRQKTAFQSVRDDFLPGLSEAKSLKEFKLVLSRMNKSLKEK